jgi:choline dehydrogenase-like flavoprotein
MQYDADVIVIGAGSGGIVAARELGEKGVKVLVLEAGPWYGNKKWPEPNLQRGPVADSNPDNIDIELYERQLFPLENDIADLITGKIYRFGPADRRRPPWFRNRAQAGMILQAAVVGGTSVHYWGNSPRAYPEAIDNVWPISYRELIPYYERVEATLPVTFAEPEPLDELFLYGGKNAGWEYGVTRNVTRPMLRPQPNAILPEKQAVGTNPLRSTNISYLPLALETGNVTMRPNTFTTKILTQYDKTGNLSANGVAWRDTWTGETGELYAKVLVMAGGTIESPRLWLNSGLPHNPWVGKGLTTHYFDYVFGLFDERDIQSAIGTTSLTPYKGTMSSARLDLPGLGSMEPVGLTPGWTALWNYGYSKAGYSHLNPPEQGVPWHARGRVVGSELKEMMASYNQTLSILIVTDDAPNIRNGVTIDPLIKDEHGPVPLIRYNPSQMDSKKRDKLCRIAGELLLKAGAKKVVRCDWPTTFGHIECTMRMGFVVDANCEAFQVKGLFIADNSVHFNGLGSPNPTLTTQALATRTADKVVQRYFS